MQGGVKNPGPALENRLCNSYKINFVNGRDFVTDIHKTFVCLVHEMHIKQLLSVAVGVRGWQKAFSSIG